MKIPFAPELRAGETVYSFLARIAGITGNSKIHASLVQSRFAVRPVWPVGLEGIAAACPDVSGITAGDLFWEHTPAPAFLPFITAARRDDLIRACMLPRAGEPARIAGARALVTAHPESLRICPQCMKALRCYRVVHQMPGVVVCPYHPSVVLRETDVSTSPVYGRRELVRAVDAVVSGPCALVPAALRLRCAALAKQMDSLLARDLPLPGPEKIRQWLRHALKERGYRTPFGKVRVAEAADDVSEWLGTALADVLGVSLPNRDGNASWLARLLNRTAATVRPLEVVLISEFLGLPILDVLRKAADFQGDRLPATTPMPRGISDAHRRYEDAKPALRRLWPKSKLSIQAIGRNLGVRDITVRRWAVRAGLPFPRRGPTAKVVRPPTPRRTLPPFRARVAARRQAWLKLAKKGHRRLAHSAVYCWLTRYDRAWLLRHRPKRREVRQVDWHRRDREFAAVVPRIVAGLLRRRPVVRASTTRITVALGLPTLFSPDVRRRLPRTMAAIARLQEPHRDYVPRRLHWLAQSQRLGARPLREALKKRPALRRHPLILPLLNP